MKPLMLGTYMTGGWFSHSSGGQKSEIEAWTGLVPSEAVVENLPVMLSWLLMASGVPYLWMAFFLCLYTVFSPCGSALCVHIAPLYKDAKSYRIRVHSNELISLCRGSIRSYCWERLTAKGEAGSRG